MRHAHAEAQRAHGQRVGDLVLNGLDDERHARLVAGVDVLERGDVVATTRPLNARQIGAVVQPEVLERAQQAALEGIPQPEFDGNAAIEPLEHALPSVRSGVAVSPSRMRGRRWFNRRSYVGAAAWWNSSTTTTSNASGANVVEIDLRQRLNRREHMPALLGSMAIDEQLAEGSVAKNRPIGGQALRQDLATVRNEQQAGILQALPEPAVVERRDERLAGAGGGHDEVAVAMMPLALGLEALEHLALERPRLQVEMEDRSGL